MLDLVEYNWNEQTEVGTFTYESAQGALTEVTRDQPMTKPEANQAKYFAELVWFLETQQ